MSQLSQGSMQPNIQAAINKIIWKDESKRAEFAKDTKGSVEKYIGIKFPVEVQVKCIDITEPSTVYFVLPQHPNKALGVEFATEQLDAVAGGFMSALPIFTSISNPGPYATK